MVLLEYRRAGIVNRQERDRKGRYVLGLPFEECLRLQFIGTLINAIPPGLNPPAPWSSKLP